MLLRIAPALGTMVDAEVQGIMCQGKVILWCEAKAVASNRKSATHIILATGKRELKIPVESVLKIQNGKGARSLAKDKLEFYQVSLAGKALPKLEQEGL